MKKKILFIILASFALGLMLVTNFMHSAEAYQSIRAFPTFIDFGSVRVHSTSTRTAQIYNRGDEDVDVSVSNTGIDFYVMDRCYSTLRPGQSCSLDVRFRPGREGSFSSTIWIRSRMGGASETISLSGRGTK